MKGKRRHLTRAEKNVNLIKLKTNYSIMHSFVNIILEVLHI